MAQTKETRRYVVQGRVQGVGFRYFVQTQATALGLTGWVRNRDDGSVELEATGEPSRLEELEGLLWKGPRMSDVRGVESHEEAPSDAVSFRIRT